MATKEEQIKQIQDQINALKQQAAGMIQEKITGLQNQVQNAQTAGYGEGGRYAGQDIPEAILSGEQVIYDTGNPQLNDILNELSGVVTQMKESGKVVNPDIELTPAQITEFTNLASSQISPYYRSQIESIKGDLTKSVENLQKQYDITKKDQEASFKENLGSQRESMSGLGTTFSGQRGQKEQSLVEAQNRSLDLNALQTENQIGSTIRSLEGQIGSSNLPNIPTYQSYQATAEGQGGFTPGRTLNFGGIGGVTGTLQQQQKEAEAIRLSKLKTAARENRSLDYYL